MIQACSRYHCFCQFANFDSTDFADFADTAEPSPVPFPDAAATSSGANFAATPTGAPAVPWTRWYNIHERHSLSDFTQEGIILVFILAILSWHLYGTRTNRNKAKKWINVYAPALEKEFSHVGFSGPRKAPGAQDFEKLLKEKSPKDFTTYATGRQNVAFVDVNLTLTPRYSPVTVLVEYGLSLFFDSIPAPQERIDAILYPFDGKENLTVPGQLPGAHELRKDVKSTYDSFVWAVVNKDNMKQLRDDRYDVSLTSTKDHSRLPSWATVMSEGAEITEFLLTPELVQAIETAGDVFEYLIITDQPIDRPTKFVHPLRPKDITNSRRLDETIPKKRIYLSLRLPSDDYNSVLPIFSYFLRVTDQLVDSAHFRPEVLRKVRATREEAVKRIQKVEDDEKNEERALDREKAKKLKRDMALKGLDAKAQKKFLEKEREKELRKGQKKATTRA